MFNNRNERGFDGIMKKFVMLHRNIFIHLFGLFIITVSYIVSFYIRFDFPLPQEYINIFVKSLPFLLISRMLAYYLFKIETGSWRYVSMQDLMDTFKAVLSGSAIFIILMVFVYRLQDYPRSIFILEALLNMVLLGGSRFAIRYYYESRKQENPKTLKNVLIAGAGKTGVLILNEVRTNSKLGIHIAGFVDDNPYKKGRNIQGVPILGTMEDIPEVAEKNNIDEIIIAIPSTGYKDICRISNIAQSAQLKARVLPSLGKLIQEDTFSLLKDVSCDDLLGRKVLRFSRESDYKLMNKEIRGKAVLVTGAGGSIGSELCRQVVQFGPRILILYERHENGLYDIEIELRKEYSDQPILPVIGDILDSKKLDNILKINDVDLIFHAAAYKHVPMMEREPLEAVRNNVIGTRNVAGLAIRNKVGKFVLISTDKAVNPANIMGTTKRIAELIIQKSNGNGTNFVSVRFGNVLGSSGSVIPLFKKQIAAGGPLTVTHPEVARYFMAIPEAVQLVMVASAMGSGGEIFLLDMGEPIKISDLATDLIKRSGLEPGKDIDIVYTGLRPGEKLYEELYWKGEGIVPTENRKITMLKPNGGPDEMLYDKIDMLEEVNSRGNLSETMRLLKEIVPECTLKNDEIKFIELLSL